jgi:hypothetical protein
MPKHKPYLGNSPEDRAAASEHAAKRRSPLFGRSSENKNDWTTIGASAELAQQIAEALDKPPAILDAETQIMCHAVRSRNHVHDVEQLQQEKHRVLRSRRINFIGGRK